MNPRRKKSGFFCSIVIIAIDVDVVDTVLLLLSVIIYRYIEKY